MNINKIGIIGAGPVGATTAQRLLEQDLGDIVIMDLTEGLPKGRAMDLMGLGYHGSVLGTTSYHDLEGCGLVLITAGQPYSAQRPRAELIQKNAQILRSIVGEVMARAPEAIIIIATSPHAVMTALAQDLSGRPPGQVLGIGGLLQATRLAALVAHELSISAREVRAMVLGGAGEQLIAPSRLITVAGLPIAELIDGPTLGALIDTARFFGGEIERLAKAGGAFYSPSASLATLAQAVVRNERRVLPVVTNIKGHYGIDDDVFAAAPVVVGGMGIGRVLDIQLTEDERHQLRDFAEQFRADLDAARSAK